MQTEEYRSIITTPILGESRVGERLFDDPLYDFIDDQMMKVGSLSHASIQWGEVEQGILTLFKEKTKDIKLLTSLVQCLHHQVTPERMTLSLFIFGDFMREFWVESFPSPGDRGKLPRRKFFSLLLQRFDLLIAKYDFSYFDESGIESLLEALENWQKAVTKNELHSEAVQHFVQKLKTKLKDSENQPVPITQSNKGVSQASTASSSDVSFHSSASSQSQLTFDSSSNQSIKQTLLKVSDFLAEQEHGSLLSIRTSRYALWASIDFLPDHNSVGETQLRAIPSERVKEYLDGMKSPDLVLWRKVEKSITLAPYWIDGQLLSAQIALALEQQQWHDAIQDETNQFLSRLPKLMDLKFKDGTPFVSDEAKQWIENSNTPQNQAGNDWRERYEQVKKIAKEAGVSVAISTVNEGLNNAIEPRDKLYWQWLLAELLESNKLIAVANEQYRSLYEQIYPMKVVDWEPSFVERIKKKLKY